MKNVLVFSCGAIPAIDINFAMRGNGEYMIYGASSYDDHGLYVYKNYIGNVPFIYEPDFIPRFNDILEKYKIDFIIPLHEDMILFFQKHITEIHAVVISSCYETALLCRYKSKTYERLSATDFVPRTYKPDEVKDYPVFVKKDDDQGARHAYKVDNKNDLALYAHQPQMIVCEYLPGEEVTVDCFTDRHGKLRFVNPRCADRILAGIDVHARRLTDKMEIDRIANSINEIIEFRGPWFFQIKKDKYGKYKLLEIATRFAGAFALTLGMDINTPLMAIRDFDNKDVSFDCNDSLIEADKMFITRYTVPIQYNSVICDGINSFCVGDLTDSFFMMFIYQCINQGKKTMIYADNVDDTLKELERRSIPSSIFRIIGKDILIKELSTQKCVFISRNASLKKQFRELYGCFCYDSSLISPLIDWRG